MNFSWTLALRYLKPKRTYFSIITFVSILGVALGVAVMIVVVAVMAGYEKRIKEVFLSVDNHITLGEFDPYKLQDPREPATASSWRKAKGLMEKIPGVTSVEPYVVVTTLIEKKVEFEGGEPRPEVAMLMGVSPNDQVQIKKLSKLVTEGEFDISGSRVVVSRNLADHLGLGIGMRIPSSDIPPSPNGEPDAGEEKKSPQEGSGGSAAPPAGKPVVEIAPAEGVEIEEAPAVPAIPSQDDPPAIVTPGDPNQTAEPASPAIQPEFEGFGRLNAFGPENIKQVRRTWAAWEKSKGNKEEQARLEDSMHDLLAPSEYTVAGIFSSESPEAMNMVIMNLEEAQILDKKSETDQVTGLAVQIEDPINADGFLQQIQNKIPEGWQASTWSEKRRNFLEAVQNERGMMIVVLAFITLVAAFSIMNTILTFAVQKRREIGMMRALGAKVSQIAHIFVAKGMIIGLVGTAVGTGLGLVFLRFRNELRDFLARVFSINILDPKVYGLAKIPAAVNPLDLVLIGGIAFVLCSLAALPPVFVVARQDPAKALRSER